MKVSQSKIKLWRRCRAAYHYKYVEKLRKKFKARPLQFGTLIHECIEALFNEQDPFEHLEKVEKKQGKVFKALADEYGAIIEDVGNIIEEYEDHWADDGLVPIEIGGRAAEHEFEIALGDSLTWTGKIDAKAERNNLNWIVEHKTFTRKPNTDDRWRNLQSSVYSVANDILGWDPADGTCWDYIWSKPPAQPKLLQSGKMSQAKLDSLPNVVRAFIKKNGLDRKEYIGYLRQIQSNREKWFDRIYTPLHSDVVDLLFDDFVRTAIEILELHGKTKDMNIDRHCGWCDYEMLCRAKLTGGDADFLKEKHYGASDYKKDPKAVIHKGRSKIKV